MIRYLVVLGAIFQFLGVLAYCKDVISGKTKPNRVTWLLWFVAPMIGTAAAWSRGVRWPILPVFMAGFGPFIVLVTSFFSKKAYWQLKSFDYTCGFFSVVALLLWVITKNPVTAIVFAIVSDGFAAVPTIVKSWRYPETETTLTYLIGAVSALFGLLAVSTWVFSNYILPLYFILVNLTLTFAAHHKKILKYRT